MSDGWNGETFNSKVINGCIKTEPSNSGSDSGVPLTRGALSLEPGNRDVSFPFRNQIRKGEWYVTFWMTYDPDVWVWLDDFNLQFALHPANWSQVTTPRWDITPASMGTGLWSLADLTFYPLGHQPHINPGDDSRDVPGSRVTFDLPAGEDDEYYTDEESESDEGAEDEEGTPLEFDHPLDGDLSQPPAAVLKDLTYKGRNLANELWSTGVPDAKAWLAGQTVDPSPSFRRWRETFQKALQRGVPPLEARELATSEFLAQRESRGHAE